jgi:hypothetical protein
MLAASCTAMLFVTAVPAMAESVDVSTIGCDKINAAYRTKTEHDLSFINGILNWLAGYHATEDQGTMVDWSKTSHAFDQTVAYCAEHPKAGVMTASKKFMGDNIEDEGPDTSDLAIVTCEQALTDKNLIKNIGDTFMWLAGYHTSTNKDSKTLDFDKFVEQTGKIVDYCAANPQAGLFTASEKFMSEDE